MWEGGSITENVSDTVVAINLENGAHHSDLYHRAPSPELDTPDVTEAFVQIQNLLAEWLKDIQVSREK
jgi:lysosomal Pro-X carboxypeptidase